MKRFKKVYLEITNACNLKCSFCSVSHRKTGFISFNSFTEIIDAIIPFTDHVNLHVKGEPLLHPEIKLLLAYCEEKGCRVNLVTNGTLIGKCKDTLLESRAIRQVSFSLHSCNESIKQMPLEVYANNILDFAGRALAETNIYISFRFWNWQTTGKTASINSQLFKIIEAAFQLPYKIEDTITAGGSIKIQNRLYINSDFEFVWPTLEDTHENDKGFCHGMRDQVAILLDGTVVPCCLDGEGIINLGNIYETPFENLIESPRAKAIYDGFSENKAVEKLCIKCRYKDRFH